MYIIPCRLLLISNPRLTYIIYNPNTEFPGFFIMYNIYSRIILFNSLRNIDSKTVGIISLYQVAISSLFCKSK